MANATMLKFGYPDSLIREFEHWAVLLRPAQVTLGSLVLAAKGEVLAFGQVAPEAHAELGVVIKEIEATLLAEVSYERINYLMLMMVDPHVHFHVFPRYDGSRSLGDLTVEDVSWSVPPDITTGTRPSPSQRERLRARLSQHWLTIR